MKRSPSRASTVSAKSVQRGPSFANKNPRWESMVSHMQTVNKSVGIWRYIFCFSV